MKRQQAGKFRLLIPASTLVGAFLLMLLSGCIPSGAPPTPTPTRGPLPTLEPIVWQNASETVTVDNASQLQTLGHLVVHEYTVNRIVFSHDSRWMISSDSGNVSAVWDMSTGSLLYALGGPGQGNPFAYFGSDDNTIVSVSGDGVIKFFQRDTGQMISSAVLSMSAPSAIDMSPDGVMLAVGGVNGDLQLWDVSKRALHSTALGSNTGNIRSLAFSPDSKTLAVLVNQPEQLGADAVRIYAVDPSKPLGTPTNVLQGFKDDVPRRLLFSPDGSVLAVGGRNQVRLFDTSDYRERYALVGADLAADRDVAFSPDSRYIAALGASDFVYIWTVADNKPAATLPKHNGAGSSIAFTPNGDLMVTSSIAAKAGAFLWQVRSFVPDAKDYPRGVLAKDANGILRAFWSPDGKMLVLAEGSGGLIIMGIPKAQ